MPFSEISHGDLKNQLQRGERCTEERRLAAWLSEHGTNFVWRGSFGRESLPFRYRRRIRAPGDEFNHRVGDQGES
jgi:hypothetical protein